MSQDPQLCPVLAEPSRGIITIHNQADLFLDTYNRTVGTIVNIRCLQPNAFRLQGVTTVTCLSNGVWSPSPPTCVAITASTSEPPVAMITTSDENTVILAVVGAILCTLLLAVIIILTYLLCKWWNRKSYVAKRIVYADSTLSGNARYANAGASLKGSVFGASTEFNKGFNGRGGHSRRNSDASARTSSTTFTRHSMIVLPKPAYSQSYGPFWYYPIPDDQALASSAMRSVMDYHEDVTSVTTEPNPLYDPEIDYLQYPEEATAVDTMGRHVKYRPVIVGDSEAGTQSTRTGKRYVQKGRGDRPRQPEPSTSEDVHSVRSGRSEQSERSGRDNTAFEHEQATEDLSD